MSKVKLTVTKEMLGNLLSEWRRNNALGALKAFVAFIKEWPVDMVGENGTVEEFRRPRDLLEYLKRQKRSHDKMIKGLTTRRKSHKNN